MSKGNHETIFNPCLTDQIFVNNLRGLPPLQIFKMNDHMMFILVPMASLESPLNIDTK